MNIPPNSDTDGFSFKLRVKWLNSSGGSINTKTVKTYTGPTSGWDLASAALVAPAGTNRAEIQLNHSSLNGKVFTDDLTFK